MRKLILAASVLIALCPVAQADPWTQNGWNRGNYYGGYYGGYNGNWNRGNNGCSVGCALGIVGGVALLGGLLSSMNNTGCPYGTVPQQVPVYDVYGNYAGTQSVCR